MKRKIRFMSMLLAAAMAFSGCANSSADNADPAVTEISDTTVTSAEPQTSEEFHQAMIARSLYSTGNTTRIKEKIRQAQSGEKTTIAYIGGSITEGISAGSEGCYAKLSYEYFRDTYGTGDNVEYVNAGLSGTPSNLGVLRLERDVLSHSPDIVFIEFAVNDGQDKLAKESYESLVKTVLNQENSPAVVLLFNVIESGYTAQAHMKEIGEFYQLPMISAADALTKEFDDGRMTWDDYSDDQSHPNIEGHKLLCEFIANMYTAAESSDDCGEYTVSAGYKFGAPYENCAMVTPELESEIITITDTGAFTPSETGSAGFPVSWKYNGGSEPLKLKTNASAIFVIYKRHSSDSMGAFDVYLNGEKLKTIRTKQSDGWGEAYSEQIIKFQNVKDMEIEIRPCEDNGDKTIEILGFACCSNVSF